MADDFLERDEKYKKERELAEDVERLIDYTEEFIRVVEPENNMVQTVEKAEIVPKKINKYKLLFSNLYYNFVELLSEIKFRLKERADIVATQDCIEVRSDGLEIITENTFKKYLAEFNSIIYNYKLKREIIKGEKTYYHIIKNHKDILIVDSLNSSENVKDSINTRICDEQCMHQIVTSEDNMKYYRVFSKGPHLVTVEIPDTNEVVVTVSEGNKNCIKCTSRLDKITIKDNKTNKEETKEMYHIIFERIDRKNNEKKLEMYYASKEDYIMEKRPRIVKAFTKEKEGEYKPWFEYILLDNEEYKGIGFENDGKEIRPISYQFTYNIEHVLKECENEIDYSEVQQISRRGVKRGINGFLPKEILNIFEKIHPKYAERLKNERKAIENKKNEFLNNLNVQNCEMDLQPITKEKFEEQINSRKSAYSKASKSDDKPEIKSIKFKDYQDFYNFNDSIIADKTNEKNNTDTIICCGDSKFYRIASDDRSIVYEEYENYNDSNLDFRHCFIRSPQSDKDGGEYLKYKTQGFGKIIEYSFEEERKSKKERVRKCNIEVYCKKKDNDNLPDKEKINERVYMQYYSKKDLISGELPIKMIAQNNSTKEEFSKYGNRYIESKFKYNKNEEAWESVDTWVRQYKIADAKNICRLTAKNLDPRIVNMNIIEGGIKSIIPDEVWEMYKRIHPEVVIKIKSLCESKKKTDLIERY